MKGKKRKFRKCLKKPGSLSFFTKLEAYRGLFKDHVDDVIFQLANTYLR